MTTAKPPIEFYPEFVKRGGLIWQLPKGPATIVPFPVRDTTRRGALPCRAEFAALRRLRQQTADQRRRLVIADAGVEPMRGAAETR